MRLITFSFFCLLAATHAYADDLYVTDLQSVELLAAPRDGADSRTSVTSGTRLQSITNRGAYLKVRTEDGREGWIRESLVTADPPARARLQSLTQAQADLEEKMAGLRSSIARLQQTQARLLEENRHLMERLRAPTPTRPIQANRFWLWAAVAGVLVAIAAFAGGALWQARRGR
jgi:uncharacterized protein YgiM (DUF1202 family)